MKLYTVWSEYDLGQEGMVFSSKEDALSWGESQYEDTGDESWEEYVEGGLFTVNEACLYVRK